MKQFLLPLLFTAALPLFSMAEDGVEVTVTVTNIPGVKGNLLVGLYDSEKSFTDNPLPGSPVIPITSEEDIRVILKDVKPGTYAVSVIQDLNENGKLDKNFIGIPKEPLAFSVIKEIPRGKPKFDQCSFEVEGENLEITISLVVE